MRLPLNTQIFLGVFIGVSIGLLFAVLGTDSALTRQGLYLSGLIGNLFIDLLKMVLVPLVFTSIAVGVANLRQHQQMHRVWISTVGFFMLSMTVAIILGLTASNVFEPGKDLSLDLFHNAMNHFEAKQMTLADFIVKFFHGLFINPFAALAQGNVLAIVIFALFLGIALVMGGERYRNILVLLQEGLEIILRMVGWIMRLAPFGIMALLAQLVATQNVELLASLAKFVAVVFGTTLLHAVVVLPLMLYIVTQIKPLHFFRGAREALITAFATSSSSATLPVTLRCTEQHLHVKPEIARFVVPLGATVNMDGTALYEAAAALFIANLAGVELNFVQQLIVFFTAMIAAIGAPSIPSAGMVTMVMVLQSVGLPAEAIAILLPIDRFLDTFRTAVNVQGDMVGSLIVQKLVKGDRQ
ncbi:MAG: dicarboxylate/amino acid:cation symporter [Methylovulum sp.]|uniref:dicarboxylate/amino acid:cation symporter n=1 Tax=Methylovulum sp. TaxID=1916980 RepID=UPI002625AF50|nr:dicarboxylate/amino acid:cation symporter [Methylovulum sp.]MDD2725028.1 dicarboxylate/amino acid:cation symporter [Methylovulum sp.]MDD5125421.1 dicarboxylate/amino acid:cation symporter [Methylovulum sp.]